MRYHTRRSTLLSARAADWAFLVAALCAGTLAAGTVRAQDPKSPPTPPAASADLQSGVDTAPDGAEPTPGASVEATPEAATASSEPPSPEAEPNDSFGIAPSVPETGTWQQSIAPRGDSDWFTLQVGGAGELKILVTGVPPELEVALRVWNADKSAITDWFVPLRAGGDTEALVDLPTAGLYVIEMRDQGDNAASESTFTVQTSFSGAEDPFEPNNSFGTAQWLSLNTEVRASIQPQRDGDWLRFEVEQPGELALFISHVPKSLDVIVRVWNAEKAAITDWFAPFRAGGDTEGLVDLPAAGVYVLEIRDRGDDARAIEPFTLRTVFTPTEDSYEANDSFGSASLLEPGKALKANILPLGDSDWYRFDLAQKGELEVSVTLAPKQIEIAFRLWNSEKQVIADWALPLRRGGDTRAVLSIPGPGLYVLEVRDRADDARAIEPYTLDTIFRATEEP